MTFRLVPHLACTAALAVVCVAATAADRGKDAKAAAHPAECSEHHDSAVAANVATAKRVFLEKMGQGRFDKLDEIYGPGFVAHGASRDYTLEQDNESGKAWRAAFPDLQVNVERTVGDDRLVAVHWSARGTNTVPAAGMPGNGRKAQIEGMTFFRFEAARIVEEWSVIDIATLRRQLEQAPL